MTSQRRLAIGLATLSLVGVATLPACGPRRGAPRDLAGASAAASIPKQLRVRVAGQVRTVALDAYVLGAVLAEVSPVGDDAAVVARVFELQTIVARTYAVSQMGRHRADGFDVCDTTHCQIYDPARIASSRFSSAAREAVARTSGRILQYDGHVAETLFHADCGGSTAAAESVWGGRAFPYLVAVTDNLPGDAHRAWQASATREEVRVALNADSRTAVGASLQNISIVSRDGSGRAADLAVRGTRSYNVRGDLLRTILNRALGARAIQSTRFSVTRTATGYTFDGTGYGHGVGLCRARGDGPNSGGGDSESEVAWRPSFRGEQELK